MATVVPTRRRSSLLKGPPRRHSSTASTAAAEKGESSSSNPPLQEPQPAAVRKTHEQLAQYRADFFKRMQASLEEATAMGRRADVLGEHQRVQREHRAQQRRELIEEEAARAAEREAAIAAGWAALQEHQQLAEENNAAGPGEEQAAQQTHQALARELAAQRAACEAGVQGRQAVVEAKAAELRARDAEYVRAVEQHGRDVDALLVKMRTDSAAMQARYEREMGALEAAFEAERQALLSANEREVGGLLREKKERELGYLRAKQQREERFQREIEAMLVQEGEAYHQLKIHLELEAQAKDAEAEALRAAGGFDADRLLHDRRRLLERAGAVGLELAAQRKRLARLKEVVGGLAARFHEHDGRERKRFEELTLECARLRRQYRDLQRRFRHFVGADRERYDNAWAAHEEQARVAADKLLAIDEVVYTRILRRDWAAPAELAGLLLLPASAEEAAGAGVGAGGEPGAAVAGEEGSVEQDTAIVMEEILTNRMLALIEQEAGFLLLPPERAPAAPVHPFADDPAAGEEKEGGCPMEEEEEGDELEASQARKQRLLRALGVEEEGELRLLLTYFLRRQAKPGAEKANDKADAAAMVVATGAGVLEGGAGPEEEQEEGKQGDDDDDQAEEEEAEAAMIRKLAPLRLLSCPEAEYAMIPPEEALDALQRFATDRREELERQRRRRQRRQERARRRWQRGGSGEGDGAGEEDGCFWRRVAAAMLPDRHLRAWEGLERALVAYHRLLDERGRLLEGVVALEKGNDGLRALVQGCLDDSINDHLLAPPFPRPPSPAAPPSPVAVAAPKRAPLTPSSSSRRMTTAAAGAKRGGGGGGGSSPRTLRVALGEVGEVVVGGDFPKAEAKEGGEGVVGDFGTDGGVAAAAVSVVMEGAEGEGQEEEAK